MKTPPIRSFLLALALAAVALPGMAKDATVISDVSLASLRDANGNVRGFNGGWNGDHFIDTLFNGDFDDDARVVNEAGAYLLLDFTSLVSDPTAEAVYVTEISIGHTGKGNYSLYTTTNGTDWVAVDGAVNVNKAQKGTYGVNRKVTQVKYVFASYVQWAGSINEFEVKGYLTSIPHVVSSVSLASLRDANGNVRGFNGGWNGDHFIDTLFNGDFDDDARIVNETGAYLLVDLSSVYSGHCWVTEISIGHTGKGNYSLYTTTNGTDWVAVDGAVNVNKAQKGTYGVNREATQVKYVFASYVQWAGAINEFEIVGMDSADAGCSHPSYTAWSPIEGSATCAAAGIDERYCTECNERFTRESPTLPPLGHIYVSTLLEPGTVTSYGRGKVTCDREGCDYLVEFDDGPLDLALLGGEPVNGVIQYTDLTMSSSGGGDGGISAGDVTDGVWTDTWNGYWFAAGLSTNEYIQFRFATPIDLTKIEYSVLNQDQTVYFNKYDPATGEETLLKSVVVVKDTAEGAPGYQRRTVTFTREAEGGEGPEPAPTFDSAPTTDDSNTSSITVDAIRMRIGDVLDPDTGEVAKAYIGTSYGPRYHTCIIEVHPYGTVAGAGKVDSGAKPAFLFMQ